MSYFLNESFMVRGDEYHNMAVCNKTGAISVYNKSNNLFFSLFADGPISFHTTLMVVKMLKILVNLDVHLVF